jgi:hypothetical protein
LPERSVSQLQVKYPHPQRGAEFAQVRLIIERLPEGVSSGLNPSSKLARWWRTTQDELPGLKGADWYQETWATDIPRAEVESVIALLRKAEYFGDGGALGATVDLSVEMDQKRVHQDWVHIPQLDMLIVRARTHGKLVASVKPPGLEPSGTTPASPSAHSYNQIVAKEAQPTGPIAAPPSAAAQASSAPAAPTVAAASYRPLPDPRIARLPRVDGPTIR